LEAVLVLGMDGFLVDELRPRERRERRPDVGLGELTHRSQHPLRELLPDDGGGLQDVLLAFGEAVDARGEHRVRRGRDDELRYRLDQTVRALRPDEAPALDQSLVELLEDERISRVSLV